MPRILYVSGSFGLGHVTRDLSIARHLRAAAPGMEILWMAGEPARTYLAQAGETLLPSGYAYESDTESAESAASAGGVNLFRYLVRARRLWANNARVFADVVTREHFDAVVADEVYEVAVALIRRKFEMPVPLVMIYDFMGLDAMTRSPLERFGIQFWNWMWSRDAGIFRGGRHRALFVGEAEDIPDRPLGWRLPSRRDHARRNYHFVGYVLPFEPAEVRDRARLRAELGYGSDPVVVASIGGTAIGKSLLQACARAFPIARRALPSLQMTLVGGPRLSPAALDVPEGIRVEGFVHGSTGTSQPATWRSSRRAGRPRSSSPSSGGRSSTFPWTGNASRRSWSRDAWRATGRASACRGRRPGPSASPSSSSRTWARKRPGETSPGTAPVRPPATCWRRSASPLLPCLDRGVGERS